MHIHAIFTVTRLFAIVPRSHFQRGIICSGIYNSVVFYMLKYVFEFWCADLKEQYLLQKIDVESLRQLLICGKSVLTMWCDVQQARSADTKGQVANCPNLAVLNASMCQHLVCCPDHVPFPGGYYRTGDPPAPMLGEEMLY